MGDVIFEFFYDILDAILSPFKKLLNNKINRIENKPLRVFLKILLFIVPFGLVMGILAFIFLLIATGTFIYGEFFA